MPTTQQKINELLKQIDELRKKRDKEICDDALKFEHTVPQLAKKHGVGTATIHKIFRENKIKIPMKKGTKKYDNWIALLKKRKRS